MKVLALVYPGMTLLDLVGPVQAWSFMPGYEVQYAWHRPGTVVTDCGLGVQATHSFEDAWTDPDVLMVGGGAKPTLDLLGDSAAIAFLADRGSRARGVAARRGGAAPQGRSRLLPPLRLGAVRASLRRGGGAVSHPWRCDRARAHTERSDARRQLAWPESTTPVVPVPRLLKNKAACRMVGHEKNFRPRLDNRMLKIRT